MFKLKRFVPVALLSTVALAACDGPQTRPTQVTIVFRHGKVPGGPNLLRELLDRFENESGIRVVDETLPASTDIQHQYFITTLEGGRSDLDVVSMDVIWVPEFSRAGWLLPLSERVPGAARTLFFRAPIDACTFAGDLYGVPWYVDAGVLYYRKDILEAYGMGIPESYPELAGQVRRVLAREPTLYGFLWQGKQYEGLVCCALEVLASFGGSVVSKGRVTIASPEAREAFRFMREMVASGMSPPLVTTADEEATRLVFGSGRAVFLRNWLYAWSLFEREGSPVRGKVGVAPIPPGPSGTGGSTLGGWQLGIARQSSHPDQAWALIEFLTRPDSQARLARTVGYRPSRRSLYDDAALIRDIPVLPQLVGSIDRAHPRPVTALYPALSQILQPEISAIITGVKGVDEALEDARRELQLVLDEMACDP
ncbi:MAG: ABC transporter substrate-binding protein [Acidobacteriota bacterium]